MRVLFAEGAFGFGGSVVALARLLRGLDPARFDARVAVRVREQADCIRRIASAAVRIDVVPLAAARRVRPGVAGRVLGALDHARRHAAYRRAIRRLAEEHRAELLFVNNGVAANWGAIRAGLDLGLPVVVKQHGDEWPSADVRRLAARVECFLPDSEHIARGLAELGVPRERLVVTWCPVDLAEQDVAPDREGVRRELGLPPGAPLVAMVGMLLRWKGQHVLVEAMPRVLAEVPGAHAVFVGGTAADADPGYPEELRDRAGRLGIGDRIRFTGTRADVARIVAAADVCVHASIRPEPFRMVVAEAMASRRPVVASSAGGPAEQVEDGVTGFLVPPGDPAALATRVARLLADPELGARMGERGRRVVEERFSLERHARETAAALERARDRGFSRPS